MVSGRTVKLKAINWLKYKSAVTTKQVFWHLQFALRQIAGVTMWASNLAHKNTQLLYEIQYGIWSTNLTTATMHRSEKMFLSSLILRPDLFMAIDYRER